MPHVGKDIYCRYDQTAMSDALEAVKCGMPVRKAAERFGVPLSTLSDRVTGKKSLNVQLGRRTAIPLEVENCMAEKAMDLASKGFGIGRKQMVARAATLCRQMNAKTPFKNGVPGKDWWAGFRRRHPQVVLRKAEKLSTVRSRMLNPVTVGNYMKELHSYATFSPTHIWNMDETGINLEHQPTRVIARQGANSVPGRIGNSRENVTLVPLVIRCLQCSLLRGKHLDL